MTPMGRKHKYSNGKRSKPCVIVGAVKKHFARTASVSVDDYHFEIKQEVVDDLKNNAQCEGNELCGVLWGYRLVIIFTESVRFRRHVLKATLVAAVSDWRVAYTS